MVYYRMTAPMIILKCLHIFLEHTIFIPEDDSGAAHITELDAAVISHADIVKEEEDVMERVEVLSILDNVINVDKGNGDIRKSK